MPKPVRISVVIPYFQRQNGVLRRALASVFAQSPIDGVSIDVLVIDDESPAPPEPEIEGLSRPDINVRVIRRPNGGPARARNTGLAAAAGSDFVAFLDSDDAWAPHHLEIGLSALEAGAQFYFANNLYDDARTWFDGLKCSRQLLAASKEGADKVFTIARDAIVPFMLEECLAHTSTVIYDLRTAPDVVFDDAQEIAGEDHLFWITLAVRSEQVAFSLNATASRGHGVDLYRNALDWNHPDCIRRLFFKLMLHRKILATFCKDDSQKSGQRNKIRLLRRGIAYLLVRNAIAHSKSNAAVLRRLAKADPGFLPSLPINTVIVLAQKARGTLEFPVG